MAPLLLAAVLFIATCGIVYELLAGALASYLLGDSVMQFSTIIGVYLSAMGLGSYLSRFVTRRVAQRFVEIELAVALVGGLSAPILFVAFAHTSIFRAILYPIVGLIGTLVGLEVPLLLRILKEDYDFKDLIARVLTVDYLGALIGSLLFPILLMPRLGLVRTSLVFGVINAAVGFATTFVLRARLGPVRFLRLEAVVVMGLLGVGVVAAEQITSFAESEIYADEVIFSRQTPYQRIVLTRGRGSFQLFLNGGLQFSSADEYRYHEALVHPALALQPAARRVLVLGGGDGLAVRELLRYPSIEEIVLVDLDPEMVRTARENPLLRELNHNSLWSPKVHVINQDAYMWLHDNHDSFDAMIVDFPDPNNFSLGKLYTTRFYRMARHALRPGAPMVVQSTSPLMARASFWCIVRTIEEAGFVARPYHTFIPSFGEWGFVLASEQAFAVPRELAVSDLRYLTDEVLPTLFSISKDMGPVPVEVNRLNNQSLVQYYETEWRRWN